MRKFFKLLPKLNLRTIYFNFHKLPFKQALSLPVFISRHVLLKNITGNIQIEGTLKPGLVKIGYGDLGIFDQRFSRTVCELKGTLIIKGIADIGQGSKISIGKQGKLILSENFKASAESTIVCHDRIEIGKNCLLSWDCLIMDTDFHAIKDIAGTIVNNNRPIKIGDGVWIGCRCLILKGTSIPNGSVIGANSLVKTTLPKTNALYAGNPVKILKEDITWSD